MAAQYWDRQLSKLSRRGSNRSDFQSTVAATSRRLFCCQIGLKSHSRPCASLGNGVGGRWEW